MSTIFDGSAIHRCACSEAFLSGIFFPCVFKNNPFLQYRPLSFIRFLCCQKHFPPLFILFISVMNSLSLIRSTSTCVTVTIIIIIIVINNMIIIIVIKVKLKRLGRNGDLNTFSFKWNVPTNNTSRQLHQMNIKQVTSY